MSYRVIPAFAALVLLSTGPALAAPPPTKRIEISQMMGRWYEVARMPNSLQRNCHAGTSTWTPAQGGFAVTQACLKGAQLAEWRAKARIADPQTNARLKMSFFGGLVSQEYWVLDHRGDQGWLILSTADGKYLWLMSQRPTLGAAIKAQAVNRIRQLGFDTGRLEFPAPGV